MRERVISLKQITSDSQVADIMAKTVHIARHLKLKWLMSPCSLRGSVKSIKCQSVIWDEY